MHEVLQLIDIADENKCDVCIDYYIPCTIEISNEKIYNSKIYWRTGNFKNSLIEFAIDEKSGILNNITLVSVDKVFLTEIELTDKENMRYGTPVFRLDGNINNGLCDQFMDFCVYLSSGYFAIKLIDKIQICKLIELDRVRFGFDDHGSLVLIIVTNLSPCEYDELKESLNL